MSQTANYNIWNESGHVTEGETKNLTLKTTNYQNNVLQFKTSDNVDPIDLHRKNQLCLIASVPEDERISLAKEKTRLVMKKFREGLTPSEARELRMLQWKISSIETAEMQPQLAFLNQIEAAMSKIRIDLENFSEATNSVKMSKGRQK